MRDLTSSMPTPHISLLMYDDTVVCWRMLNVLRSMGLWGPMTFDGKDR